MKPRLLIGFAKLIFKYAGLVKLERRSREGGMGEISGWANWLADYWITFIILIFGSAMNQSQPALNINDIVKAFQTLVNPMAQKELIRAADQYITHCEAFPEFALLLMSIFTQAHNLQTKQQILIHLKNVIKRNWTAKRRTGSGCVMTAHIKE